MHPDFMLHCSGPASPNKIVKVWAGNVNERVEWDKGQDGGIQELEEVDGSEQMGWGCIFCIKEWFPFFHDVNHWICAVSMSSFVQADGRKKMECFEIYAIVNVAKNDQSLFHVKDTTQTREQIGAGLVN